MVCVASRAKIDSRTCRSAHSSVFLTFCLFIYMPVLVPCRYLDNLYVKLILGVLLCEVDHATSMVRTAKDDTCTPFWLGISMQHMSICTIHRCNQLFHWFHCLMIGPISTDHFCTSKCLVCGKRSKGVALVEPLEIHRRFEPARSCLCIREGQWIQFLKAPGFFPKKCCQIQLCTSTQHLLHPVHHQHIHTNFMHITYITYIVFI